MSLIKKNLQIAGLELDGFALSAPMAGVSNSPTRRVFKKMGASAVYSEMVSASGLNRASGEARSFYLHLLGAHPGERPFAVQIFGSSSSEMAQAAEQVAELDADIMDINMGCPVHKVNRRGEGVALMKDLKCAGEIIGSVKKVIGRIPLTIKMRSGFDANSINAPELCKIAEAEGADAVIVHGRTGEQGFSGKADWSIIKSCVEAVKIPVVGNGDIRTAADAGRMVAETGCAGVMIGRAALGNPWIFAQIKNPETPFPDMAERRKIIFWHFDMLIKMLGDAEAKVQMRKYLVWYTKGLANGIELRRGLAKIKTRQNVIEAVEGFFI
jgi:tRNA-dihydrouridine synthase B